MGNYKKFLAQNLWKYRKIRSSVLIYFGDGSGENIRVESKNKVENKNEKKTFAKL